MEISLNEIGYGNPTLEQISMMSRVTPLDALYEELSQITPPPNSSEITQAELNDLLVYTGNLSKDINRLQQYQIYDESLVKYFKSSLVSVGLDKENASDTIDSLTADINPLIARLKFSHLRARPYQISMYYRLKLFPFESLSAQSPSYPSGHAFQAKVITEVLGNLNPRFYRSYQKICDDICMSRLYMGLNYQSDIDMGMYAAEMVLANTDFKKKYKL